MRSADELLAKHTAGAPLSDAELKQRQDAARARWGAGSVAAAVTAGAVATKLRGQRQTDTAAIRGALLPVRAVRATNDSRAARLALKVASVQANLRPSDGPVFLQQAVKTLRSRLNQDTATWNRAYLHGSEVVNIQGSGDEHGPIQERLNADPEIRPLFEPVAEGRATLLDLRRKGRSARSVAVKGRAPHTVAEHTRQGRGKLVAVWSASADDKLAYLKEKVGQPFTALPAPVEPIAVAAPAGAPPLPSSELGFMGVPEVVPESRRRSPKTKRSALSPDQLQNWKHDVDEHWLAHLSGDPNAQPTGAHPDQIADELKNVHSLHDLKRHMDGVEPMYRKGYRDHHLLPSFSTVRPLNIIQVPATVRSSDATQRRTKSYPGMPQRKTLADELRRHIERRAAEATRKEQLGAVARLAEARRIALKQSYGSAARLSLLTPGRRIGVIAAAAGAAGITAAAIASRMTGPSLQKAAPRKSNRAATTVDTAPTIQAADQAETEVAKRLAAMFGRWTAGVEDKLAGPSATTMHADMTADLTRALAPVDDAFRAGALQPVAVEGEETTPRESRVVALSLLGRNPAVTSYLDTYRQDRVVELADEQREAIKGQLIAAAQEGASPQLMARRIRETIGLTAFQMQHVVNYRTELEDLEPNALTRALRDQRFDGPISRAMESGQLLEPDAIDRYVDAYHRRYLAYRAMTIARTEGVGGANNGQAASAIATEAENPGMTLEKTWIARKDSKTRHDHFELDGQVVLGLDTPFECDSGDEIRWPHDPRAPARQVINCRCAWVSRLVPIARVDTDSPDPEQQENVL